MKYLFKNSLLVLVLAGLFALPLGGFSFMRLGVDKPEVLGSQSQVVEFDKKPVEYVDQLDLDLNLNDTDNEQKFYNILPEEYVRGSYQFIPIYEESLKEQGVSIELVENELSLDVIVRLDQKRLQLKNIKITVLVLR